MAKGVELKLKKNEVWKFKLMGYSSGEISIKTGIPQRTVTRYISEFEEEWRVDYKQLQEDIKIHKLAELNLIKKQAHKAIASCEKREDYSTISRLLNNILKTIDSELVIFGVGKTNQEYHSSHPLYKQIKEMIEGGIDEVSMSEFIEWVTEKYKNGELKNEQ